MFREGKPCKKGHTLKYTRNGACAECQRVYIARHRATNPPDRAKELKRVRAWEKAHPEVTAAKRQKYYRTLQQARVLWANQFFIDEAYDLARRRRKVCGGEWAVDHIVPLRGQLVSGLHVENNLQVIPKRDNTVKANHLTEC